MRKQDFYFDLPKALIAAHPTKERTGSRLLQLDGSTGAVQHGLFPDVLALLKPGDLLVFNNTKVVPARLFAEKPTGGKVEILIERVISDTEVKAQMRSSKAIKPGAILNLLGRNGEPTNFTMQVTGREDSFYLAEFVDASGAELMQQLGHMPLPPYIERSDSEVDFDRYQTVYAKSPGAVAAPTAGLHFDQPLLAALTKKGINFAQVTLHVGAGTFQPLRVDDVSEHVMHKEWLQVEPDVVAQIAATKAAGGRVVAVGTTAVRCLETAAFDGVLKPYRGDTQLFITPGFKFKVVDILITNFHLAESTLLMLVSAFAGREHVLAAYNTAVREQYRFFSYGDAMFVLPSETSNV